MLMHGVTSGGHLLGEGSTTHSSSFHSSHACGEGGGRGSHCEGATCGGSSPCSSTREGGHLHAPSHALHLHALVLLVCGHEGRGRGGGPGGSGVRTCCRACSGGGGYAVEVLHLLRPCSCTCAYRAGAVPTASLLLLLLLTSAASFPASANEDTIGRGS